MNTVSENYNILIFSHKQEQAGLFQPVLSL